MMESILSGRVINLKVRLEICLQYQWLRRICGITTAQNMLRKEMDIPAFPADLIVKDGTDRVVISSQRLLEALYSTFILTMSMYNAAGAIPTRGIEQNIFQQWKKNMEEIMLSDSFLSKGNRYKLTHSSMNESENTTQTKTNKD